MGNISPQQPKAFDIIPPNPPNEGILFVDHSKAGRSGHLGHALVEYEDGKILVFYPNCSDDNAGHSGVGWMEFKRSEDGGRTWSEPIVLEYSKRLFDEGAGKGSASVSEKAVRTKDGAIVLFNLVFDISQFASWKPLFIPTYIRSRDGGRTWTKAKELCDQRGRVYDVLYHKDTIMALEFCNDSVETWTGTKPEHVYRLYVSTDGGETFSERSALPFGTYGRGYGTMEVLKDGRIIACVYNIEDEHHLEYVTSADDGYTWSEVQRTSCAKKIRNPQMVAVGDLFFLHGRSGNKGDDSGHFVLYTSPDGIHWDSGMYLRMQDAGHGAYSNNLVVGKLAQGKRLRLLIQASHAYEQHKTNILHWWIDNIPGA
jgi:Neuraminidase (sialidase)